MGYIFERPNNNGIIRHSVHGEILNTAAAATIFRQGLRSNIISIQTDGKVTNVPWTEIDMIMGNPRPGSVDETISAISSVFPGISSDPSSSDLEMGEYTAQGDGNLGQVISIPISKSNVTSATAFAQNANAITAGIQSQILNGQNLEITLIQAQNGQQLQYLYLAK